MLTIRLQRNGRSGHAQYRMVVQDSRKSPTSGKIVTSLGSYNPHTKNLVIDKEKAGLFLSNGAQPSPRVISLLEKEGVKIPDWAQKIAKKERAIKNVDKLRKNRPAAPEEATDEPVAEPTTAATESTEPKDDSSEKIEESDVPALKTEDQAATEESTPDSEA